jgi:hypothetical protein
VIAIKQTLIAPKLTNYSGVARSRRGGTIEGEAGVCLM